MPPRSRDESSAPLARRLRELRSSPPGGRVTQAAVAKALGASGGLVSSWENGAARPSTEWLLEYATLFGVDRSYAGGVLHRLPEAELTEAERTARDALHAELTVLSEAAGPLDRSDPGSALGSWHFPDGGAVRIVCGRVGAESAGAYANPVNPNYTRMHEFADPDALIELFGHVRMLNPDSDVRFLLGDEMTADDLTAHVVLLGGLEQNRAARFFVRGISLPIEQVPDDDVENGEIFRLEREGRRRRFLPTFFETDPELGLVEDVGLFARMPNPNFQERTLTLCNGVFSRGVVGAVRILTDARLRESNERFLAERFAGHREYGLLVRVPVFQGVASTPDLNNDNHRLFTWPAREDRS